MAFVAARIEAASRFLESLGADVSDATVAAQVGAVRNLCGKSALSVLEATKILSALNNSCFPVATKQEIKALVESKVDTGSLAATNATQDYTKIVGCLRDRDWDALDKMTSIDHAVTYICDVGRELGCRIPSESSRAVFAAIAMLSVLKPASVADKDQVWKRDVYLAVRSYYAEVAGFPELFRLEGPTELRVELPAAHARFYATENAAQRPRYDVTTVNSIAKSIHIRMTKNREQKSSLVRNTGCEDFGNMLVGLATAMNANRAPQNHRVDPRITIFRDQRWGASPSTAGASPTSARSSGSPLSIQYGAADASTALVPSIRPIDDGTADGSEAKSPVVPAEASSDGPKSGAHGPDVKAPTHKAADMLKQAWAKREDAKKQVKKKPAAAESKKGKVSECKKGVMKKPSAKLDHEASRTQYLVRSGSGPGSTTAFPYKPRNSTTAAQAKLAALKHLEASNRD